MTPAHKRLKDPYRSAAGTSSRAGYAAHSRRGLGSSWLPLALTCEQRIALLMPALLGLRVQFCPAERRSRRGGGRRPERALVVWGVASPIEPVSEERREQVGPARA